ncbi:YcaO-like family protein [Quadrisphaera sp. DSM 44207]|uniref:YcaO-like family protein n=1 Tax=Quadrisphaera sp. DSM 44207 TaxID=1881057 RepID=UPI00088C2B5B|nr:YcaO-like family protein [Quadrisphaera sp. DSM 44207]SDQ22037.1 ribosomal protein S12 methylthiotransferase accessory factor [Quadrisphaera sp. DSM 44207]
MSRSPADVYREHLPPGRGEEFALDGLDRVGVPVHAVRLIGAGGLGGAGIGYGATREDARTGAHGELAEAVLPKAGAAGRERPTASYAQMARREGADRVADPVSLVLEAGSDYDADRPLQWLATTRLSDGETVWAPAELVASDEAELPGGPPPGGWLTTPVTNGQGAGLSRAQALSHALLEVLQRDGDGLSFRAMGTGVVVDLAGLDDPVALDVLARLEAADVEPVVKLASTAFGVPVVYCVGAGRGSADDALPVVLGACGEAAHPDAVRAVRKALLEFAAARARLAFMHGPLAAVRRVAPPDYVERVVAAGPGVQEPRALAEMLAWTSRSAAEVRALLEPVVLSRRSSTALADLPSTPADGGPQELLDDVAGRLRAAGTDVLVAEVRSGPVSVVKALVPGLEVETMSYGRIGERGVRALLERPPGQGRELVAVGRRPDGLGWARVHLTAEALERLGGPAWLDRDGVAARVGRLYPLYREPGRHAAALARGER